MKPNSTRSGRLWEKKQKQCDPRSPEDAKRGDQWDFVALGAESRLVVSMVPGKRTKDKTRELVEDFAARTGGTPPALVTSDEYAPYTTVLRQVYGQEVRPPKTGKAGRPPKPYTVPQSDLVYATVCKKRKRGRVVSVRRTLVYGTEAQLAAALEASPVSATINTSFVERYNGTDRCFNSRKVRATYGFSKKCDVHEAATWIGVTVYNFCRVNRGLTVTDARGVRTRRTPAMAAGLSDHPLSLTDIIHRQLFQTLPRLKK